jgi:hypothetical protein
MPCTPEEMKLWERQTLALEKIAIDLDMIVGGFGTVASQGPHMLQTRAVDTKSSDDIKISLQCVAAELAALSQAGRTVHAYLQMFAEGSVVLQMRDVDRAKVYSQHLGKKLRKGKK